MDRAKLLYRSKLVYPDGAIREMVIWLIHTPKKERRHGLKYRLYYGNSKGECLVRYDNETGKGDNRHMDGKEEQYPFTDVETLIADFQCDIDKFRREK